MGRSRRSRRRRKEYIIEPEDLDGFTDEPIGFSDTPLYDWARKRVRDSFTEEEDYAEEETHPDTDR